MKNLGLLGRLAIVLVSVAVLVGCPTTKEKDDHGSPGHVEDGHGH